MPEGPHLGPPTVRDPGLQSERTRLAWSRTALSFAAVGALLLHSGSATSSPTHAMAGLLVVIFAVTTYLLGVRRYHVTTRNLTHAYPVSSPESVRALALLTVLTSVITLVLVLR